MNIVRLGIFNGGTMAISLQRGLHGLALIQFHMLYPLLASGKGLDHLPPCRRDRGLRGAV